MGQIIFPSLMAKNQRELTGDLERLKGIKTLHLDIADGKFVNNKTFQFPLKLSGDFQYQAHLMVKEPASWVVKHGSLVETIVFHPESFAGYKNNFDENKICSLIKKIKNKNKKAGLGLRPETPVEKIKPFLKMIDWVLVLTVSPGFYGGKYLPENLKKIKQIKKLNPRIKVLVDGGMNPKTIRQAARAGAEHFVSGSYTTKAVNPKERIKELIKAIKKIRKN